MEAPVAAAPLLDDESREWIEQLNGVGAAREDAVRRLHALLLRAARFELGRRRRMLLQLRGEELDDLALQAADDALVALLARPAAVRGRDARFRSSPNGGRSSPISVPAPPTRRRRASSCARCGTRSRPR
jgi:hypothetical protein